ncbi:hypothetical protein [Actinoplanes nipponensis]|uniref:hypothetical protein n=1 Tax=Actinoplanes nipponensis TaxID=135950 RepID=UPI0031EE1071
MTAGPSRHRTVTSAAAPLSSVCQAASVSPASAGTSIAACSGRDIGPSAGSRSKIRYMPGDHVLRPVRRSYSAEPRLPSSSVLASRRWSSSRRCQQSSRPPSSGCTVTSNTASVTTPARCSR